MSFYIKANRIFNPVRKYSWLFTLLVGLVGLWYPRLGLLVIPVMVTLTTLALFKGRYWCGNVCSHGSLFDVILMPFSRNGQIPRLLRSRVVAWLFFAFFGWNIGSKVFRVAGLWGTMEFWDRLGFIFVSSYLMVMIVGGLLAVAISPRTWCNFCPMGTLQVLSYRLGKALQLNRATDEKITVVNQDMCHTCGKCSRVCPLQLSPYTAFSDTNQFEADVCIRCSTCVFHCPAGILSLNPQDEAIQLRARTSTKGYEHRVKITATVAGIRDLAPAVKEFTFHLDEPRIIQYTPGQFILVKIQAQPEMYRAYSISGYNKEKAELRIAVKQVPDGYGSGILFEDFHPGMEVELEGPMGHELVVDRQAEHVLLVAGGIGITPFLPIVEDLAANAPLVKTITLVYGVNQRTEFLYDQDLQRLQAKHNHFTCVKVAAFDNTWSGPKGFVTDVMNDMDLTNSTIYMCGPKPMTNAALGLLAHQGIQDTKIFLESA